MNSAEFCLHEFAEYNSAHEATPPKTQAFPHHLRPSSERPLFVMGTTRVRFIAAMNTTKPWLQWSRIIEASAINGEV